MVMNKILFFTLSLVMAITAYGQNSASVDTLQTASDSIIILATVIIRQMI